MTQPTDRTTDPDVLRSLLATLEAWLVQIDHLRADGRLDDETQAWFVGRIKEQIKNIESALRSGASR
jgi:hypothetical protein